MPSGLPIQVAATFARSRQNGSYDAVGWHTRMLYSFTAAENGDSWSGEGEMFSAVAGSDFTKGNNQFPPGYWDMTQGRILRIKGMFYYDTINSDKIYNSYYIFYNYSLQYKDCLLYTSDAADE